MLRYTCCACRVNQCPAAVYRALEEHVAFFVLCVQLGEGGLGELRIRSLVHGDPLRSAIRKQDTFFSQSTQIYLLVQDFF